MEDTHSNSTRTYWMLVLGFLIGSICGVVITCLVYPRESAHEDVVLENPERVEVSNTELDQAPIFNVTWKELPSLENGKRYLEITYEHPERGIDILTLGIGRNLTDSKELGYISRIWRLGTYTLGTFGGNVLMIPESDVEYTTAPSGEPVVIKYDRATHTWSGLYNTFTTTEGLVVHALPWGDGGDIGVEYLIEIPDRDIFIPLGSSYDGIGVFDYGNTDYPEYQDFLEVEAFVNSITVVQE